MFLLNLILFISSSVFPAFFVKLPMQVQTSSSSDIVHVKVEAVTYEKQSFPDADPALVFTKYTLKVQNNGKIKTSDSSKDTFYVYELGGKIGNIVLMFQACILCSKARNMFCF